MASPTHLIRSLIALLFLVTSTIGLCSTLDQEPDGEYFRTENIPAVKRILAKEDYDDQLKVEVLEDLILAGKVKMVQYLATRGWLKVCRKAESCHTVDYATGSVELLQFLLSQGFPITKETLRNAATSGRLNAVKFLCNKGVDPNARFQYETYSDKGKVSGVGTVLDLIKASQPYSGGRPYTSGDPLRDALYPASIVRVAEFLESGQCKKGALSSMPTDLYTEEVAALRAGNVDATKQLFERRDTGKTHPRMLTHLLYEAVASGNIELLQYLKDMGWIRKCRDIPYCRPFEAAAQFNVDEQVFKFLLEEQFQPDEYSDAYGATPLHYAALYGHIGAVKFLCRQGANPNNNVTYGGGPKSLLTKLRENYGNSWCGLHATKSKAASEACDPLYKEINGPDCMPGTTCLSIKFPPDVVNKNAQELIGLSEVFYYLKDGGCKSGSVETCKPNTLRDNTYFKLGTVMVQKLNVRSTPGLSGETTDALPFGTTVKINDGSGECVTVGNKAGRWVKITNEWWNPHIGPTVEGWVFDAYLDYLP